MSRRFHCKADANQPEIVEAIRRAGATVLHLHTIGKGCPDICIGYAGLSLLAEIKDGSKPQSAQRLTSDEQEWHDTWKGGVYIVRNVEDALNAVLTLRRWGDILRGYEK